MAHTDSSDTNKEMKEEERNEKGLETHVITRCLGTDGWTGGRPTDKRCHVFDPAQRLPSSFSHERREFRWLLRAAPPRRRRRLINAGPLQFCATAAAAAASNLFCSSLRGPWSEIKIGAAKNSDDERLLLPRHTMGANPARDRGGRVLRLV